MRTLLRDRPNSRVSPGNRRCLRRRRQCSRRGQACRLLRLSCVVRGPSDVSNRLFLLC